MKMAPPLDYTDFIGDRLENASKKQTIDFPTFVAKYLLEVIQMEEFDIDLKKIKEKLKHLSFLAHLMCYEDFDKVEGNLRAYCWVCVVVWM